MTGYVRRSTVEQPRGVHPGTRTRGIALVDVVTDLSVFAPAPYDTLPAGERAWWDGLLHEIHATEVAIARMEPEVRARFRDLVQEVPAPGDLDAHANWMHRLILLAQERA